METKRKVLILYVYDNHHELIETIANLMRAKGFVLDAICVSSYRYTKESHCRWPLAIYIASFFIYTLRIPKSIGFFKKLLDSSFFKRMIDDYEIIDFQAFPVEQCELAEYCISMGKEYVIGFWGSDALRADNAVLTLMKESLAHAKKIRLNNQIKEKISSFYLNQYGMTFEDKYTGAVSGVTNGNKDIFVLDSLTEKEVNEKKGLFCPISSDKLTVTVGYNGNPRQNQEKVLRVLNSLSAEIKNRVHLVLPMTYGSNASHISLIKNLAETAGFSYTILDSFLTNKEVCVLRKITNIFITLQETDGFAGSVRSHLYCQNVCLIADWLDYPIDDNGVYYLKVNWDNLYDTFSDIVSHYGDYHLKCANNKDKMTPFMSWDRYIDMLCEIYK